MDAKEDIKQRLSVEEVVGDYIQLQRAGRNLKALSPFSNEKTPSLMVSPEKQIWHDFSSGKGGDIFTFVMEMDGVDFVGALEILARKANVDLSQYRRGDGSMVKKKERTIAAHELAIKYYHATLAKNPKALGYLLNERCYSKKIITEFQLGYAPTTGDALVRFLSKKGFTDKEITDAGLASSTRGIRDMFRSRIMVPLYDAQGRPVGFTGRILGEGQPKYLNTPQTSAYDKSGHIFGLSKARQAIRDEGFVVVVEGNMDVVAAHMAGTLNTVAVAGTSLTRRHLTQLSRIVQDIRIAFDNDEAGYKATLRSIPIAQEAGVSLSVVEITEGKDPDEIIKNSPASWKRIIKRSEYVVDWLLKQLEQKHEITSALGKKSYSDEAASLLSRLTDEVEKQHYVQLIASKLGTTVSAITQKIDIDAKKTPKKKPKASSDETTPTPKSTYQDLLIGLLLRHPDLREVIGKIETSYFENEWQKQAVEIIKNAQHKPILKTPKELQEHDVYVKIALFRAEELYGSWNTSDRMIETIGLARRLLKDYQKAQKTELAARIAEAEKAGDIKKREELLKEFNILIAQRK